MLNENHIVEKSNALVWAQMKEYGAGELKILDTYLSRINARDPDSSLVTFTKKEYAELMGIDPDVRTSQLKSYTAGLLRNVVTIELPEEGYVQYPLFSEAKCVYDKKANQTVVKIDCNSKLREAFFDLAGNKYVTYQLKNVIKLRSQYSIRLYTMLKTKHFGWTVSVDELKTRLCATAPTYNEFKEFNKSVLKKAIEEINSETDLNVEIETVRKGRAIDKIKFTISNKIEVDAVEFEELPPADPEEPPIENEIEEHIAGCLAFLPEWCTLEEAKLLWNEAVKHVPYYIGSFWEKQNWVSDYMQEKVLLMRATPNVKSEKAFLRGAIGEDWQPYK